MEELLFFIPGSNKITVIKPKISTVFIHFSLKSRRSVVPIIQRLHFLSYGAEGFGQSAPGCVIKTIVYWILQCPQRNVSIFLSWNIKDISSLPAVPLIFCESLGFFFLFLNSTMQGKGFDWRNERRPFLNDFFQNILETYQI